LRVRKSASGATNADTDTAEQIADADCCATPEEREAGKIVLRRRWRVLEATQLALKDNSHNNAVDCHCFTENNAHKVLGTDARRADCATQNRRADKEDPPCSAADREADREANSDGGPHEGVHTQQNRCPGKLCGIEPTTGVEVGILHDIKPHGRHRGPCERYFL